MDMTAIFEKQKNGITAALDVGQTDKRTDASIAPVRLSLFILAIL